MKRNGASRRDWALLLGPQAFVGRSEGVIFTLICFASLLLVSMAEFAAPKHATLGAFVFIPVIAASWLLSRRLALTVLLVALGLRLLSTLLGPVDSLTAAAQMITLPIIALAARQGAVSTLKSRRTEARLTTVTRESARNAELERAKSDFLRMASHELRGPVAILRGYISMLDEGSLGQLPDAVRAVMPTLMAKVTAMNRLVEDMLETARLEDSRLQLQRRHVQLDTVVRGVASAVKPTLDASHRLQLELPSEAIVVDADAERVATILSNLVDNAIKYSPAGGQVLLTLRRVGNKAIVEVRDQGIGIAPEDQERLFRRFGRVVTPQNQHISGTGLGLYLSRQLARMHGGDIKIDSKPGGGSTFALELPVLDSEPAREGEPQRSGRRELA
jgi:signal transduction histidine kinase